MCLVTNRQGRRRRSSHSNGAMQRAIRGSDYRTVTDLQWTRHSNGSSYKLQRWVVWSDVHNYSDGQLLHTRQIQRLGCSHRWQPIHLTHIRKRNSTPPIVGVWSRSDLLSSRLVIQFFCAGSHTNFEVDCVFFNIVHRTFHFHMKYSLVTKHLRVSTETRHVWEHYTVSGRNSSLSYFLGKLC
jgi:hypothetical protein